MFEFIEKSAGKGRIYLSGAEQALLAGLKTLVETSPVGVAPDVYAARQVLPAPATGPLPAIVSSMARTNIVPLSLINARGYRLAFFSVLSPTEGQQVLVYYSGPYRQETMILKAPDGITGLKNPDMWQPAPYAKGAELPALFLKRAWTGLNTQYVVLSGPQADARTPAPAPRVRQLHTHSVSELILIKDLLDCFGAPENALFGTTLSLLTSSDEPGLCTLTHQRGGPSITFSAQDGRNGDSTLSLQLLNAEGVSHRQFVYTVPKGCNDIGALMPNPDVHENTAITLADVTRLHMRGALWEPTPSPRAENVVRLLRRAASARPAQSDDLA